MLSFHRCIHPTGSLDDDTYINNLTLRVSQRTVLQEARTLVRRRLRTAFAQATAAFTNGEAPITPSFFTQGSWGYRTINRPTHVPPQQTDMDDGCYLPMSFVRGVPPKRAASWFYDVADSALRLLVKEQGWRGYKSKDLCCRVIIDDENHIDVPLYAIRDEQFQLMKSLTEKAGIRFVEATAAMEEDEHPFDWSMVSEEDVLIANRNGQWKPSNPRIVSRWVESVVEMKGDQLRVVWREIKGWRDHQYPSGGPSSIALMVMVATDFKEIKGRDDLALLEAARSIGARIAATILAPWDHREDLNRLTSEERQAVADRARLLEEEIESCTKGSMDRVDTYLLRWRHQCGRHFSNDRTRVEEVSPRQVVHAYAAAPAVAPRFRGDNRSA